MANSIQYAKTISTPSEKLDTNELSGRIRVAFAEYEASAEQSTITMFTIPNGARILSGSVSYDALGSSTTISVGHAAYVNSAGTVVALDVDEYKAAAASTSAQSVVSADTIALGKNSVVNANEDGLPVTVTLAGDDGTGTIQLQMFYVID
jgi:predicted RNA methylase